MTRLSRWIHSRHNACSSTFFCLLHLLLSCKQSSGDGKYELTVLDEDDDLEKRQESQGIVVTSGLHLQVSRAASLDESLLKRGVLLRLELDCFGGLSRAEPMGQAVRHITTTVLFRRDYICRCLDQHR